MINCCFKKNNGYLFAFEMKGHADNADYGKDIVCAAVSSACELTIHLCEEYYKTNPSVDIKGDGELYFTARENLSEASKLLNGLKDYMEAVKSDYPQCISIKILEV